jgi:iron-sulfur cluster repair protein YtfE (RIC family)
VINKTTTIEELVEKYPASVEFLREKQIRCIRCGEPIWGTLKSAAKEKGVSESDIENIVVESNDYLKT